MCVIIKTLFLNLSENDDEIIQNWINIEESDSFRANAIAYLAGFVVKMTRRYIKCDNCLFALLADTDLDIRYSQLMLCKDRGGLIYPSFDVIKICNAVENVIQIIDVQDEKKYEKLCVQTMRLINLSVLFNNLTCPSDEEDNNHVYSLVKIIILCYGKIKFHHRVKNINLNRDQVRNHMTRIIINAHHQ